MYAKRHSHVLVFSEITYGSRSLTTNKCSGPHQSHKKNVHRQQYFKCAKSLKPTGKIMLAIPLKEKAHLHVLELPCKSPSKMFMVMLLFFCSLFTHSVSSQVKHSQVTSRILVMGVVYCDICSNNSFSKYSYYIQGAEVKIVCKFNALSPRTEEKIQVNVNRTTNKSGIYKLEIPAVDGIQCAEEAAIMSVCEATLLSSSSQTCNLPGIKTTSDQMAVKSKGENVCIYSFNPLSYKPAKRDVTLCSGI